MKIYVVILDYKSATDDGIQGVFSTREKAVACIEGLRKEEADATDEGEELASYSAFEVRVDDPGYGCHDVTDGPKTW